MPCQNAETMPKPKLVYFQWKHDKNLSDFVVLHRQQHVKCLSAFFEVTIISNDCDYSQICDKYEPDLALFESGVAYKKCYKINISNTYTNQHVPRLGLHNSDAWCDARASFLSDMYEWGIETFFTISTTTAEHLAGIEDQLFVWPNFIDPEIFKDYKLEKTIPIMFSGCIDSTYTWRQNVYNVLTKSYPYMLCPHHGYTTGKDKKIIHGIQYAKIINSSYFMPTCGTVEKEFVRKHLEIPGSMSCLITEKTPIIEAAGFEDMINCVFADESNVLDKVEYLFNNQDKLKQITSAGHNLAHSRHSLYSRSQIYEWFALSKKLQSSQRIVQSGPFGNLKIVDITSKVNNIHIACNGLSISLLLEGDKKLLTQRYKEAEKKYLECYRHIYWLPEAKIRIAICKLHKGNTSDAIIWIVQPILRTLEVFKALQPDPIEWALLILTVICNGDLVNAKILADSFSHLSHPVLTLLKAITYVLCNITYVIDMKRTVHHQTIHQLPYQELSQLFDEINLILKKCRKHQYSSKIKSSELIHNFITYQHEHTASKSLNIKEEQYIDSISSSAQSIEIVNMLLNKEHKRLKNRLKRYIKNQRTRQLQSLKNKC